MFGSVVGDGFTVLAVVSGIAMFIIMAEVYTNAHQIAETDAHIHERDVHENLPGFCAQVLEADVRQNN
jgi:hypothetical protein